MLLFLQLNPVKVKKNDTPAKKPIKQILHKQIQKENSHAMPKNVRFEKQRPRKNILLPLIPASAWKLSQEDVMADFELTIKKNVKHKRHPRIIRVLKECQGNNLVGGRINDLLKVSIALSK